MLLFMLIVYGMNLLTLTVFTKQSFQSLNVRTGFFGIINFLQFYLFYIWTVPVFLKSRNWIQFLLRALPVLCGFILLKYLLSVQIFPKIMLYQGYRYDTVSRARIEIYTTFWQFFRDGIWTGLIILLAALALRLFIEWLREDKRRSQLRQQMQQAESGFLKMQLNSHFLINSLNSIYSLALVGSPEVVPANKTLAHLLSYMVDQPNDVDYRSPIRDEINYLCDFIKLQRLRTGCEAGIIANFSNELPDKQIAPMLLVAFVENAFKHGITNQPDHPVRIDLLGDNNVLHFSVFNQRSKYNKDKTGGIGLENVKKRLQLIYPDKHHLTITETPTTYFCNLSINW
ncbi:histidine kinase [Chitinophaga dinghuensis]|uniref:Histidine kinase n=2 Tax=Chitinophaga dinghuensis TaxID=1539050 RepID=A0A327VQM0_9BACT|nr:histidine kinase [Chitinophaga dinghuensis]